MNTPKTYTLITILVVLVLLCMRPRAETFIYEQGVETIRKGASRGGRAVKGAVGSAGKGAIEFVVDKGVKPVGNMYKKGGNLYFGAVEDLSDLSVRGIKGVRGGVGSVADHVGIKKDNPVRRVYAGAGDVIQGVYAAPGWVAGKADTGLNKTADWLGNKITGEGVANLIATPYGMAYDVAEDVGGVYMDGLEAVAGGYDTVIGKGVDAGQGAISKIKGYSPW